MMHMIKLCVGVATLEELESYRNERAHWWGANYGEDVAVFEPTHGSAPKYAGQNRVNPIAMMLSGVMMLRHLEETGAADRLEGAIAAVIEEGRSVTYDMKPSPDDPTAVGTSHVADAIIEKLGG